MQTLPGGKDSGLTMSKGTDAFKLSFTVLLFIFLFNGTVLSSTITGKITDSETGEPISFVTIRVLDTDISIAANKDGDYRLKLDPGTYRLKYTHLSYYSVVDTVETGKLDAIHDVVMKRSRIEVPGITVSASGLTAGQKIVVAAIDRKEEILSRFQSYSYEAYVKFVVREEGADDSTSIVLITETQHECFWESPDRFKEIVTAQRTTANIENSDVIVSVGNPVNFNKNRIDLGRPVVSPTAEDALDYYDYYLIDTIYVDNKPVFRLDMQPRKETSLLFKGEILIADSTYDVVGIDCEFNDAFDESYIKDPHFTQRYAVFDDEYWMPVEIRFEADVELPIPGIPRFFAEYVAALHEYHLNYKLPDDTFDEYAFEISEEAFDVDSTVWASNQLIPLTEEEIGGYLYLDSVASAPKSFGDYVTGAMMLGLTVLNSPAVFHFNRVEGTYIGYGDTFRNLIPRTKLYLASGYAITGEYWQHNYRANVSLWDPCKLKLIGGYRDKIMHLPTVVSGNYENTTIGAALNKTDQYDYYLERGFDAGFSIRPVRHFTVRAKYLDYLQSSVKKATEYSMFRDSKKHKANPEIDDGKLRGFSLDIEYDSRMLMKVRGEEYSMWASNYTLFDFGCEMSLYDLESDFEYMKFDAELYHRHVLGDWGTLELKLFGGLGDRGKTLTWYADGLPIQRHYVVDFGGWIDNDLGFKTLGETNFYGEKAATVYFIHDFGNMPFRLSGLPFIKDLPFSLAIYGGQFWTSLDDKIYQYGKPTLDDYIRQYDKYGFRDARKAYREVGFRIGNIPPLNFKLDFTWQLSDYDTNDFSVGFDVSFMEF